MRTDEVQVRGQSGRRTGDVGGLDSRQGLERGANGWSAVQMGGGVQIEDCRDILTG